MSELKMFTDDHDWVIARDLDDALTILGITVGADGFEPSEWEELDPGAKFRFHYWDETEPPENLPEGAEIWDFGESYPSAVATVGAWIKFHGRGYFASSEH